MNNEFVMVPRVPTDEMKEAADGLGFAFSHGDEEWNGIISADMAEEIYQVMIDAKPAEQHQGEPLTLPARREAIKEWATPGGPYHAEGWNACLDEIAKLGPLYTRVDTGEVTLQQIMHAYEYAESHHHEYLRGTTNWCAAVAWHLNKNGVANHG